ncbi:MULTISPECIES: AAA family ATPase [Bacillaceae]|uniref:AAA domain-containing protein n=2 Tax=Bacillaceae TaxID=186817 RepID=A0A7V7RJ92_9BACI|nr:MULTISPECIES: hypothetical protein [Bacillaceae]KAB2329454.1 hypothetical protein F7732_21250 [Bacillus mesophilum]QVY63935.1 hypothetical protein J1899_22440 [Cytobacillus gottheilii]
MKTVILKPTEALKRIALLTQQFTKTVEVHSLEELEREKRIDVILLEQNEMSANDIISLREKFINQKILILTEQIDAFFEKSCITHDVLLLSMMNKERELLDKIQKTWFGLQEQTEFHNVIAFHGTHRQVGVTQLALSVGHTLGTFNHKTLVIGLNPYNPGEVPTMVGKSAYSFEQIYDLIQSNVIYDGQSLFPYLTHFDSFSYLVGNRDFYKAGRFESEPVEKLIRFAKDYFQVVILDIGSFYDSFLPLTGLKMSNTHILVSSQDFISVQEYKMWKEQVLNRMEFYPKTVFQVVNKFASKAIMTPKQMEENHQLPILTLVPYFPESNDAILEDGILKIAEYTAYSKVIDGLAKTISTEITDKKYKSESTNFLKGLFKKVKN